VGAADIDELSQRVLAGHFLHFFCMRKLVLGEGANGRPKNLAIDTVLASEVIVYGGFGAVVSQKIQHQPK
jgi:hypothetical protein